MHLVTSSEIAPGLRAPSPRPPASGWQTAPGVKPLAARRHYPTLRIKPYRRSPLRRLQWIFGFSLVQR